VEAGEGLLDKLQQITKQREILHTDESSTLRMRLPIQLFEGVAGRLDPVFAG
jgi:hypothetical protein